MEHFERLLSPESPANHPLRRVAGAAGLVRRYRETGLTVGLTEACHAGKPGDHAEALTEESYDHRPAYVGRGRARDVAINVVLPYLHALDYDPREHAGESSRFMKLYRAFGKLQANELIKEMSHRLLNPTWRGVVTSARRQQVLIQLHRLLPGAG